MLITLHSTAKNDYKRSVTKVKKAGSFIHPGMHNVWPRKLHSMNTDPKLIENAVDIKKDVDKAASKKKKVKSLYKLTELYEKMNTPKQE